VPEHPALAAPLWRGGPRTWRPAATNTKPPRAPGSTNGRKKTATFLSRTSSPRSPRPASAASTCAGAAARSRFSSRCGAASRAPARARGARRDRPARRARGARAGPLVAGAARRRRAA
jgi:hypothetical protein